MHFSKKFFDVLSKATNVWCVTQKVLCSQNLREHKVDFDLTYFDLMQIFFTLATGVLCCVSQCILLQETESWLNKRVFLMYKQSVLWSNV